MNWQLQSIQGLGIAEKLFLKARNSENVYFSRSLVLSFSETQDSLLKRMLVLDKSHSFCFTCLQLLITGDIKMC